MTDAYTENLADFGFREISILRDLLNAWVEGGLPENFGDQGVKPAMNRNSGNVFLVNEDYQVAMQHDGKLVVFHSTPYAGHEGFLLDLMQEHEPSDLNQDDIDYILDAFQNDPDLSSDEIPDVWQKLVNAEE